MSAPMPLQPAVTIRSDFGTYRVAVWFFEHGPGAPADMISDFVGSGAFVQATEYAEGYETSAARVSLSEIREISRHEAEHPKVYAENFSEPLNELYRQILSAEVRESGVGGDMDRLRALVVLEASVREARDTARRNGL